MFSFNAFNGFSDWLENHEYSTFDSMTDEEKEAVQLLFAAIDDMLKADKYIE